MYSSKCFEPNLTHLAKISTLASVLSVTEAELLEIAASIPRYYKPGRLLKKKSGAPRLTHDAKEPLKTIHERIKNRILKQAQYPYYILGGIADPVAPRSCTTHARVHTGKRIVIAEDIADFYPNATAEVVYKIWMRCFHFSPEVAEILARLTTYHDQLPQGWKTSGYLANLVFWDREPELVALLEKRGYRYSRFMDDITVSSKRYINDKEKSFIISSVYGLLYGKGFRPKRSKHEIMTPNRGMMVTGIRINGGKPGISKEDRRSVRSAVFHLEQRSQSDRNTRDFCNAWKSASGRVGRIRSLHEKEGALLRQRLNAIKPPEHLLSKSKRKGDVDVC